MLSIAGRPKVIAGVGMQGRFVRGDGIDAVGTGAHGPGVEGGVEDAHPIEALEEVLREDADGREAREEGGVGIRQAKDDRAQIGRPHLDAGPGGDQAGVAAEVGGENLFDGEGHIEGAHGSAVVPAELGVETEGVGAAVLTDFGKGGEVGKQAAIVPGPQETGEDEPGEVLVDGIIEGEEGVDSLRGADNALDVDAALGSGRCRERLRRLLLGEA